jgi:hypothetical protein
MRRLRGIGQEQDLMGKIFMRCAIVAGALLLPGSFASAASPTFCASHSDVLKHKAALVLVRGGCGQNMNDPFWSTNKSVQGRWCLSTDEGTVIKRLREMDNVAEKCDYCRGYADLVSAAAADNIKYGCGLKAEVWEGDERWKPDREFHFIGCIKFEWYSGGTDRSYGEISQPQVKQALDAILGDVTSRVAQCKASKGIGTSSSALTVPKGEPAFQDTFQRKKHPFKPSTKSGDYLSTPSGTSKRRATSPKGRNTSGNDLANPSGGTARRAADPCQSPTAGKPCKSPSSLLGPGILEGDGGFARQRPAGAGSPLGTGGSSGRAAPTLPPNLR